MSVLVCWARLQLAEITAVAVALQGRSFSDPGSVPRMQRDRNRPHPSQYLLHAGICIGALTKKAISSF